MFHAQLTQMVQTCLLDFQNKSAPAEWSSFLQQGYNFTRQLLWGNTTTSKV
jgi:hypothetical protein